MRRYSSATLIRLAAQTLEKEGLSHDHAMTMAEVMVDADSRGHHSHGLSLLPLYQTRVREGGIKKHVQPRWLAETASTAILDAQGIAGQVAARIASERCAVLAIESGIAAVAVRNTNHIGMLAAYRFAFQKIGAIGLILNLAGVSVTPPSGMHAAIGNNAWCLIVPQEGNEPFVIDCATGEVACGRIREAATRGELVPPGWLIDSNGDPSSDPNDLDRGGAVPVFGGHKGLGVSILIELLAGALGGNIISPAVRRQRLHLDEPMKCSHFFIGINPARFGVGALEPFVKDLQSAVLSAYVNPVEGMIYFPDQRERASSDKALKEGTEIGPEVEKFLELRGPDQK